MFSTLLLGWGKTCLAIFFLEKKILCINNKRNTFLTIKPHELFKSRAIIIYFLRKAKVPVRKKQGQQEQRKGLSKECGAITAALSKHLNYRFVLAQYLPALV